MLRSVLKDPRRLLGMLPTLAVLGVLGLVGYARAARAALAMEQAGRKTRSRAADKKNGEADEPPAFMDEHAASSILEV